MTLWEINKEIEEAVNRVFSSVDEETGEVSDEAMQVLTDLQMAKEEKLENIGLYIKNLKAEAKAIKEEEEALKKRRESKEKKAESLSKYVTMILNGEKWESSKVAFTFRKSSQTKITDIDAIPEAYKTMETTWKADKTAIKKAIEAGEDIAGAHIEEKINMSIK